MILLKNFEIRTVLYDNDLVGKRYLSQSIIAVLSQPKIQFRALQLDFITIFFHFLKLLESQSKKNVTWKIIFDLSCMISQKTLKSGQYFAKTTLLPTVPVTINHRFSQHNIQFTQLQKGIFNSIDFRNFHKSTRKM